jgi:hypothetical protein
MGKHGGQSLYKELIYREEHFVKHVLHLNIWDKSCNSTELDEAEPFLRSYYSLS